MNSIDAPAPPALIGTLNGRRLALAVAASRRHFATAVIYGAIAAVTLVTHGVNALHSPYLEDDEGSYTAYAWAVAHLGQLGPYHTYFYEHPPLGWIQLALWQLVTGIHTFGYAIASGRVFMLVLQTGSSMLVYACARRLTGKVWLGLVATAVFTLAPAEILYQRSVLLDNIAAFWMLVSIFALLGPRLSLRRVWLSAATLAVAVLSKEIAIAVAPAVALLAVRRADREIRLFATVTWVALFGSLVSLYPLMALLKGELFPSGTALGGSNPHVSLLCTLEWQASRGRDGGVLNPASAFWTQTAIWAHQAPLLFIGGLFGALACLAAVRTRPEASAIGASALLMFLFLGRSGIVIGFYVLPLLPLLALALVCSVQLIADGLRRRLPKTAGVGRYVTPVVLAATLAYVGLQLAQSAGPLWTANPVQGQLEALSFIRQHVPPRSGIIIDQYLWLDLHDPPDGVAPRSFSAPLFDGAQYYWKAAEDPEVQRRFFPRGWRSVDYVITTPQLLNDTQRNGFPILRQALDHSRSVAAFDTGLPIDVRLVSPRIHPRNTFTWLPPSGGAAPSCMT